MQSTSTAIRRILLASVVFSVGGWSGLLQAAAINPAVEASSYDSYTSSLGFDSLPHTIGYEFTTSQAFALNALGYFDDGSGNSHQVGLWDTSGNLLVSTTVTGGDPVQGHFRWQTIPDYDLVPGTYVIGGEYLGYDPYLFDATGLVTIPGYSWVTDLQVDGAGLNFPNYSTGGGFGDNGILVADFSVSGVPDAASTLGLLGGAFAAMGALRRGLLK